MAFANPAAPNVIDFSVFVLNQGVPSQDLPTGTLATVGIAASGAITAASAAGTVAAGMAVVGPGIGSNTFLTAWNSGALSGTVIPAPAATVETAGANVISPYLQWAFDIAIGVALVPPSNMPPIAYVLAVYNLGMHQLLKIGQDLVGQSFFAQQRALFKMLTFQAGPVAASADQSTSTTLVTADFIKGLTMQGLDLLNTPWGREYLAYAQSYGPNIVGVS